MQLCRLGMSMMAMVVTGYCLLCPSKLALLSQLSEPRRKEKPRQKEGTSPGQSGA